ncbi:hypothetical protein DL98DRAFT_40739 [Cadophora sp. DSE1049]|nr:hypothetical protein DL98DRAFT_40739 [Cadophora sp. DSE1049]
MGKKKATTTGIDEHCSQLGYGKVESKQEYKRLLEDLHTHFIAYEKRCNYLGSRETLSDDAVLCATSYLEEESRGETFWPENDHGRPVWPRDQSFITNAIAHIIRRKGISSYIKRHSNPKPKADGEVSARSKRSEKSRKKRRRDESDDEDLGFAENLQSLTQTTVKPWNEPPKNPDPRFCCQYIQTLNPNADVKRLTDFTTEWLTTKNSPWPESADVKLQTFMHNRNFYVHYDCGEDPPRELINILRKGSALETLENGPLSVEFQSRIRDRVELLTHRLTKAPYFVLEFRRDGAAQMTKPFANKWRRKEEYWKLEYADHMSAQPAPTTKLHSNKRRKSKATKSPVAFPNLCGPTMATPTKAKLASMAGTALQMATHEWEDQEMADENMSDVDEQGSMFVSDALAVTTPRSDDDQSRSISPDKSIVADNLDREAEGSPNTSPDPSPSREQTWDALRTNTSAKDLDGARFHDSPDTRSQATQACTSPLSDLSNLRSSIFQTPTHNQLRPGSISESPWALDDSSDDEPVADRMIIDEPGNVKYLKIEPVSDAFHPVPTTTDHQPSLYSAPPPSGETAPASPMQMQIYHDQMTSMPQQLQPPLLNIYPPRFALPPKPSDNSTTHLRDNERPADISIPPASSSPIATTASPEPMIESPRPPTIPSVSSPTSPSRAFDKFLSRYGNRGSGPEVLTPSKETQPVDSGESIMSPKERIRAEKRAEVRAQAAEWEEIRSRGKKSKSRTKSPPQASMTTQEMPPPPPPSSPPPPPPPAMEPLRTESTSIVPQKINPSTADYGSSGSGDPRNQPSTSIPESSSQVSSPIEKLQAGQAPDFPVQPTTTDSDPSGVQQPQSSSTTPDAVHANGRIPSASTTHSPNKQARRPLLVPNLTKPISPMVSKIRASTPAQGSNSKTYWSPLKTTTEYPVPATAKISPPPVAHHANVPNNSAVPETSTASMAPESPSESLSIPPLSETTPVPSMPSICHTDVESSPVLAAVQAEKVVPRTAPASVTPSPSVNPKSPMSSTPPAPISRSSNISMGVAAATARTLATQTEEFLKKGGGDRLCTNDSAIEQETIEQESIEQEAIERAATEQETIVSKTSEPTKDLPQPRCGAYAHVPESTPFSATPSAEEIAAMQALQQPHSIKSQPGSYVNQERSIVKSSLRTSGVKTLKLLIESASGELNLENGYSFDVIMNNTLSGFFSFYAAVSEAPLESFQQLIFTPTWPNCSTTKINKQSGEPAFKILKKIIQTWYTQAQKADPDEMEFQIMVQKR